MSPFNRQEEMLNRFSEFASLFFWMDF